MVMGDNILEIALPHNTNRVVIATTEMHAPLIVPSAYWLGVLP